MKSSRNCKRGEIYYIKSFPTTGHEQKSGRPAVIVSNNENNANSGVYEICYLTLKEKKPLPTHVVINSGLCVNSTILCEQVTTVAEDKIGDYMCYLSDEMMDAVDEALAISLGLTIPVPKTTPVDWTSNDINLDVVLDEIDELRQELKKSKASLEEVNTLRAKVDMYERMYNALLDRLIKG